MEQEKPKVYALIKMQLSRKSLARVMAHDDSNTRMAKKETPECCGIM